MKQKTRVLYVEDEPSLGKIVHATLEKLGYDVFWEVNGANVISSLKDFTPDICVLDIMLPGINGFSLCKTIRGLIPGMPVIFLTAKTETQDIIKGFDSGGTDYIRKPFSIEELTVRIENQLRLHGEKKENEDEGKIFMIGSFICDTIRYELRSQSEIINLSNRDMQVLQILNANRNNLTVRKDILMTVWGDDSYFNSRNLDVYIRKFRRFFASDPTVKIVTLKSNGYLFIAP
jgi:DNA-binding response OmpR family regulator